MLKENALDFVELGRSLYDVTALFGWKEYNEKDSETGNSVLNVDGEIFVKNEIRKIITMAERLNLVVSKTVASCLLVPGALPQNDGQFGVVVDIFKNELRAQTFLFVPPHLAKFYEKTDIISDNVRERFPSASEEIVTAATSLAVGGYTACVFHSMRAAEIGLRALGSELKAKVSTTIDEADWMEIINGLSKGIAAIENLPKSTPHRSDDLQFFSEAAAQFRFFKNGWRVRVAHARASYNENQATDVLEHIRSFFEVLATRLSE